MSNSIYEEAILDAKALKEAAEMRAKQKLVEAMTPKIKLLVENSIFEEDIKEEDGKEDGEEDGEENSDPKDSQSRESKPILKSSKRLENESFEVTKESAEVIKKLMTTNFKKTALQQKLNKINESVKSFKKVYLLAEGRNLSKSRVYRFNKILNNLNEELKSLKDNSIINSDTTLLETYLKINKELKTMSRRRNNNYLNENLDELLEIDLFEDDDDDEGEEFSLEDQGDDPVSSGEGERTVSQEILNMSLGDVLDAAEDSSGDDVLDISGLEDEDDESDDDMSDILDDDDEDDDDEDSKNESWLREIEEAMDEDELNLDNLDLNVDEVEEMHNEIDEKDGCYEEENEGRTLEIDENMLRREIGKMKRLREGEASAMASHFGGGSLEKEMFVDVDDGLLNALADQVGDAPTPTLKKESALRRNAQRKNRLMQKQLKEYKSAVVSMKKELNEMNLFNAKLLYANKLMQNRGLSIKQQKHIVESLDNASTLNEAKLLFESLSKSLTKSRSKGNLNESASRRILGSSSRSVGSSQSAGKNADLDRWAILAGIKK